jgi:excisionase family DNA binding protein
MPDLLPLLLTPQQAARSLTISVKTLRRLEQRGELHAVRIGTSVRFVPAELENYIERLRTMKPRMEAVA